MDPAQLPNIALDGKTVKGTAKRDADGQKIEQLHLVMACTHEGRMLLQESVDKKENEIVAVRKILERMPPLRGAVITGDAINTQQEFAHTIVWEKGALSVVVERQPKRDPANRAYPLRRHGGGFFPLG